MFVDLSPSRHCEPLQGAWQSILKNNKIDCRVMATPFLAMTTVFFGTEIMKPLGITLNIIPFLSVLLLLLGASSLRLGGYPLLPSLYLIPIFYWLVFRPDLLPLWSLFSIGLIYDSLMGYELGLTSFLLIISAIAGHFLRPYLSPHRFMLIWGAFGLYSFVYLTFYGLVTSGGIPLIISWMYGIILYPLVSWVLSHLHLRIQVYV